MAGVFDLELHDTPEGEEDISDEDYFEPDEPVRMVPFYTDDTVGSTCSGDAILKPHNIHHNKI